MFSDTGTEGSVERNQDEDDRCRLGEVRASHCVVAANHTQPVNSIGLVRHVSLKVREQLPGYVVTLTLLATGQGIFCSSGPDWKVSRGLCSISCAVCGKQ